MKTRSRPAFEWSLEQERARQGLLQSGGSDVKQLAAALVDAADALREATTRERHEQRSRAHEQHDVALGCAEAVQPADPAYLSAATGVEVRLRLRMEYVPTAYVHVLEPDEDPLISLELRNSSEDPVRIRVRSFVEGYSAQAVDLVEICAGRSECVDQLPTFFPRALAPVAEATRATLHVQVDQLDARESGLRIEEHRTFRIWLLPRTTAVLWQPDPSTGQPLDRMRFLGCWVTPNALAVMQCLREAVERTPARSFIGHARDPAVVRPQVQAIYEALAHRGLEYINSIAAICAAGTFAQRVRLPRESLENRCGNCVDRTVLFASLLEAASLRPAVVTLPGHTLLGWNDGAGGWGLLETTVSQTQPFERACEIADETLRALQARGGTSEIHDIVKLRGEGLTPLE